MKGSPVRQVQIIWEQSGIDKIGESRHEAKEAIKAELKEAGLPADSASINKELDIYSYKTADDYRDVWRAVLNFARDEYGIRDIEALTEESVQGYLLDRIQAGIADTTAGQYASALNKLERAINMHCENRNWPERVSFNLNDLRQELNQIPKAEQEARAFYNPQNVIDNLKTEDHKLIAQAQLEGGFRISEINHLKAGQLQGVQKDPVSGEEKGKIEISRGSKGGKVRETFVSKETYSRLEKAIQNSQNGRIEINKKSYNTDLKQAGKQAGDRIETNHALRHNFAQNRVNECCNNKQNFEQAKQTVSTQMGHNRPEVTEIYLR